MSPRPKQDDDSTSHARTLFKEAHNGFQFLNFNGSVLQIFISCCYNNDIKQMPEHC